MVLFVAFFGACTPAANESVSAEEVLNQQAESFRERIMNQRIMLDDALRQLDLEKKQVKVLEGQIELNKEQLAQAQTNQKMMQDYENLQNALARRTRELQKKEKEYAAVNLKLDKVLAYLEENNIALITNELGDIEDVKVGEGNVGLNAKYDSLFNVLQGERTSFDKTVKNLNTLVAAYQREAVRWRTRFNKRGLFISNLNANFRVNFVVDSAQQQGSLLFKGELARQIGRPGKASVPVRITCSLPNGNLIDLYNQVVEFGRKDTLVALTKINSYTIEAEGLHQFVVYLGSEEVYYEDMLLQLP